MIYSIPMLMWYIMLIYASWQVNKKLSLLGTRQRGRFLTTTTKKEVVKGSRIISEDVSSQDFDEEEAKVF